MSGPALASVRAALDRVSAAGRSLPVWWRDDDAVRDGPELERLFALSRRTGLPVAVAAIPALIEPSLVVRMRGERGARVLVHGWRHANHAPAGEKPAEFGPHRPEDAMSSELVRGRETLRSAFGDLALDVVAPPWNRIGRRAVGRLAVAGYRGLSTFGLRPIGVAPQAGLVQVNTHIDPIDWRGTRGLAPPEGVADALRRNLMRWLDSGSDEPIGLLTHHLVMDDALWSFCAALLDTILSHPCVHTPELDRLWRIGDPT